MRRFLRNPIAVTIAFGLGLVVTTATCSAAVLPPFQ